MPAVPDLGQAEAKNESSSKRWDLSQRHHVIDLASRHLGRALSRFAAANSTIRESKYR
jgi:hypothetical protein